jgi:hypothetical protein
LNSALSHRKTHQDENIRLGEVVAGGAGAEMNDMGVLELIAG